MKTTEKELAGTEPIETRYVGIVELLRLVPEIELKPMTFNGSSCSAVVDEEGRIWIYCTGQEIFRISFWVTLDGYGEGLCGVLDTSWCWSICIVKEIYLDAKESKILEY